ncbi:MAG: alkaline phosphatase D family protein [Proteobacteria bacterium]|nr:alkaline phosphatase D family protein [Pseudomonadota bacterium]
MNDFPEVPGSSYWLGRRRLLGGAGACAALAMAAPLASRGVLANPVFAKYPFSLGVASGDPLPDGVLLWTRLAPEPLDGGGMPMQPVSVTWEVAADEEMKTVKQKGSTLARPELGHAVHVEVQGLEPGRWYWYRFISGTVASPIGRTRTAPAANAPVDRLRFAFASCQHYEQGYYTAHRHLAGEDLDLVLFLGDYIYETKGHDGYTRRHDGPEIVTLEQYRNRYALYKSDPDLQAAHAAFPWVVTSDDHEVVNDYAGDIDRKHDMPRDEFLRRRTAAYQAYYEHMPLRRSAKPSGPNMLLYRRLAFGGLAEFNLLDTRQYRTAQPCGGYRDFNNDYRKVARCSQALDPSATMLGAVQERWLLEGLGRSRARWNVLAQQVPMMQWDRRRNKRDETRFNMDKWDGYLVARKRVLDFLANRRPSNPIVVTGDVHANWVGDLLADFDNPDSAIVGSEFVGTSMSSGGDGKAGKGRRMLAANPHIKFVNKRRGYVRCTVTEDRWQADYRVVPFVTRRGAPISTRASFVVENGVRGVESA